MAVLFFDTETTNLPDYDSPPGRDQPHVVQLAAVLADGRAERSLARLRGFEGRNRLGGVKNGFESQKSALQSRLRLTRCDGDPGRRLGRQLQLQSLQEQFQIRLRLRISA